MKTEIGGSSIAPELPTPTKPPACAFDPASSEEPIRKVLPTGTVKMAVFVPENGWQLLDVTVSAGKEKLVLTVAIAPAGVVDGHTTGLAPATSFKERLTRNDTSVPAATEGSTIVIVSCQDSLIDPVAVAPNGPGPPIPSWVTLEDAFAVEANDRLPKLTVPETVLDAVVSKVHATTTSPARQDPAAEPPEVDANPLLKEI